MSRLTTFSHVFRLHFFSLGLDWRYVMNERRALGFGLCAVLLWSTVATAFKLTLQEFSPVQMLAVATIVSAGVLLILCLIQKKGQQIIRTFISKPYYYLLLGLINPLAYYLILFKAYDLLPASQAQSINYSWAITLTLMAAIFLGQKVRKQDWVACSISYIGVIVIATQGDIVGLQFDSPMGVSLALLSTLLWAGYWILNTKNTFNFNFEVKSIKEMLCMACCLID